MRRSATPGPPVVVFPTSMGAFFEYEDRGMIRALADKLEHGQLRLFCVSSVDSESWYSKRIHPRHRVERHLHYEDYLLTRWCRSSAHLTRPRRDRRHRAAASAPITRWRWRCAIPTRSPSCVTMGGAFDISQLPRRLLRRGLLFPEPAVVPAEISDDAYYLDQFRRNKWVLVTGDHDICRAPNEQFSGAARTPRASRTACTCGTTRSTTGRTGGRWRRRTFHD